MSIYKKEATVYMVAEKKLDAMIMKTWYQS